MTTTQNPTTADERVALRFENDAAAKAAVRRTTDWLAGVPGATSAEVVLPLPWGTVTVHRDGKVTVTGSGVRVPEVEAR